MIPISLKIKGLYSYQKEQTIDFTNLTNSHLFGIFGKVGSGKSAILEAISFALYGETERLNKNDNRGYNMMNLKSDEMVIDFVFQTDAEYRFVVKGKRNKKNFDKIRTFERSSYKKIGNEWVPQDNSTAEIILGLSYKNFRRTIIIPQGKFQEFLTLTETDRTRMLKDIFSLDKYDLYNKVLVLEKDNLALLNELEGKIKQIGDTDLSKEPELLEKEKDLLKLNEVYKDQLKNEKDLSKLKELNERYLVLSKKFELLKERKDEVSKREKFLERYELVDNRFSGLFDQQSSLDKEYDIYKDQLESKKIKQKNLSTSLDKLEREFQKCLEDYKNRDLYKTKIDDINNLLLIEDLNNKIKVLETRIAKGEKYVSESKTKVLNYKTEISDLKKDVKEFKLLDIQQISDIKKYFVSNSLVESVLKEVEKDIKNTILDINNLLTQKKVILEKLSIKEESEIDKIKEKKRAEKKEIETKINEISLKEGLHSFSKKLKEGDKCPLCGSKQHPERYVYSSKEKTDLEKRKKEIEKLLENIDDTRNQINIIDNSINDKNKLLKDFNLKKQIKRPEGIDTLGYKDEKAVDKQMDIYKKESKLIEEKQKQIEVLYKLIEEEEKQDCLSVLDTLKKEKIAYQSKIEVLSSNLKLVTVLDKDLDKDKLEERYNNSEKRFIEKEEEIKKDKQELDILKGDIKSTEKFLDEISTKVSDLKSKIGLTIKKYGFSTIEEINSILREKVDLKTEKEWITKYNEEYNLVSKNYEELKNNQYPEKIHKDLILSIKQITSDLQQKNQEYGELKKEVSSVKKNIETLKKINKEKKLLETRQDNLSILKTLFWKSGFVNFVSTIYLQNLCDMANTRFYQLTKHSFKLELDQSNNFVVRDFMNGGKIRSIKTLSGGQTFQAALCLALALADNVKSVQKFFFLDEGFGSLDKDSLNLVFDTLKSLRKENRIVGIISHVEDLKQEIPVYLNVTNTIGSIISNSWE